MGNKHEKLQTSQFVCTWFGGGGVLIIRKRLQQLRGGGLLLFAKPHQHATCPPYLCRAPPLWHLHSVKLPPLSVHDSLSPADSDNNAPCVWLQVLHPLLQPNRPLVIHFFSFVCRIPFPLCVDEWRFFASGECNFRNSANHPAPPPPPPARRPPS